MRMHMKYNLHQFWSSKTRLKGHQVTYKKGQILVAWCPYLFNKAISVKGSTDSHDEALDDALLTVNIQQTTNNHRQTGWVHLLIARKQRQEESTGKMRLPGYKESLRHTTRENSTVEIRLNNKDWRINPHKGNVYNSKSNSFATNTWTLTFWT